jgi:hypothetical protein
MKAAGRQELVAVISLHLCSPWHEHICTRRRMPGQVLACRWLGMAAVEPTLLAKMSDIMRKEVEKAVAEAPGKPQPEVRSHHGNRGGVRCK